MEKKILSLDEVLGVLKKRKAEFEANFGITAIGIFGSLARGEGTPDSDVDVVVKMAKPDLFYMEKMNAFLKKRIDLEAIYV